MLEIPRLCTAGSEGQSSAMFLKYVFGTTLTFTVRY